MILPSKSLTTIKIKLYWIFNLLPFYFTSASWHQDNTSYLELVTASVYWDDVIMQQDVASSSYLTDAPTYILSFRINFHSKDGVWQTEGCG